MIAAFDLRAFLATCAVLAVAFVCGGLIGLERQVRQRQAGLRTMVLVSVGAAAFVHLGGRLLGGEGEGRVIP
ncbi:MAG TPA: MgtC/SapB family protein, partial [Caulobacteraceae bacterium]|nr:MgtC/SapB family protein [Caulobacteraceae bacterium]